MDGWTRTWDFWEGRKGNQSITAPFRVNSLLTFVIIFFVDTRGMRRAFFIATNRKSLFTTSRSQRSYGVNWSLVASERWCIASNALSSGDFESLRCLLYITRLSLQKYKRSLIAIVVR
jgi:hypothetical protein